MRWVVPETDGAENTREFDAFISYTRADEAWAHTLANNLERLGLHCFLDVWEIKAGDALVERLDDAIVRTMTGVFVASKAAQQSLWVNAEYQAMMKRQVEGKQSVIAVVIEDVELPPLLDRLTYISFRDLGADTDGYEAKLNELKRAIEGRAPKDRPEPGSALNVPLGEGVTTRGSIDRTLEISATSASLHADDGVLAEVAWSWTAADDGALRSVERIRRRPGGFESIVRKNDDGNRVEASQLHGELLTFGKRLGAHVAAGDVGTAIVAAVSDARSRGATLRLGLKITDDALRTVPWETLVVPDMTDPLVLDQSVDVYRQPTDGASVVGDIAPPLRILVCIASPDDDNRQHKLLDVERELALILDAVEGVRNDAYVRVLNGGTAAEITAALNDQRFHVLHVSCHAGPGVIALEHDDGSRHRVTAQQFANEVLPPNRRPPLIVLAGCATNQLTSGDGDDDGAALTGFAKDLTSQGVTGVIAMSATVTDAYASEFCGHLYRHLASTEEPAVVRAVAEARQRVEADRRSNEKVRDAEWATPVLTTHQPTARLYNPDAPAEDLAVPTKVALDQAIPLRAVDEFVGRRKELREIRRALTTRSEGVVIRGMGGVGKSTLAAKVLEQLADDSGLIVPIVGATNPDDILETLGKRLVPIGLEAGGSAGDLVARLAMHVRQHEVDWQDRLGAFVQVFNGQLGASTTLLVDNFEDNLHPENGDWVVTNDDLAGFLAAWAVSGNKSRLLITSRYPFELPNGAHERLTDVHLGPLSFAETRKLMWRLAGLDVLSDEDKLAAWRMVGGHPRTLEFLDALLRGEAEFADVEVKLRGLGGAVVKGGTTLDTAAAEAIALSAKDTILSDLVDHIDATPGAKDLLMAASVYRRPVDELGLVWHQDVARAGYDDAVAAVEAIDVKALSSLSEAEHSDPKNFTKIMAAREAYADLAQGPREPAPEHGAALAALQNAGLLSAVDDSYVVHRWTAAALAQLAPDAMPQGHRDGADYYQWRFQTMPQDREADLADLEEARFHAHATGDLPQAFELHEHLCLQLQTLGYYQHVVSLIEEAMTWSDDPMRRAADLHQIGIIAQQRGDYDTALARYEQSLTIFEELGNRAHMANSYHQIGIIAQQRGDYDTAQARYEQSLTIDEELGNRAGMASSISQLGVLARVRGDHQGAISPHLAALSIRSEIGSPEAMIDLRNLHTIRLELGDDDFVLALREHTDDESAENVISLLDRVAAETDDPPI